MRHFDREGCLTTLALQSLFFFVLLVFGRFVQAVLDGVDGVATLEVRKGAFNALNKRSGALGEEK